MRLIDADALLTTMEVKCPMENDLDSFMAGMRAVLERICDAPTAFKWHDPDEELPKKSGLYICLSPINNPYSKHCRVDLYRWNNGHFWWSDSEWGEGIVTDCHWWAEIPKMPKMEETECD